MSEVAQSDVLRKQYDEEFDVAAYYKAYYSTVEDYEEFNLKYIQRAFESGQVKGDRILDFACGPVAHRLGLASKYCNQLTFADFSGPNRAIIQDWLNSKTPDDTMKRLFHYLAGLEGFHDLEDGCREIECRTRSKTTGVIKCDVHDSSSTLTPPQAPFDVIYSFTIFESACINPKSLTQAVKNIANLLNPGGYFISSGFTEVTFYKVGDLTFSCGTITKKQLLDAFADAGFRVLDFQTLTPTKSQTDFDCDESYHSILQKI